VVADDYISDSGDGPVQIVRGGGGNGSGRVLLVRGYTPLTELDNASAAFFSDFKTAYMKGAREGGGEC
jgi:hypothetical protein